MARLGHDTTYPGDPGDVIHRRQRPACPIPRGTKDTVWVPAVAAQGWLIVTRDHNIRENPAERRAVRTNGARMIALSGEDAKNTWGQLELFMRYWRQIEAATEQPGPFIYLASRSRLRPLDLDD